MRPEPALEAAARRRRRPRLLLLTDDFTLTPAARWVGLVAPHLQRLGLEITVGGLGGWDRLGDEVEARGVRAIAFGRRGPADPRAAARLVSFLRRERTGIVHAMASRANLWARVIGRSAGVPAVLTTRHASTPVALRLMERATERMSDVIVTWSEADRRRLLNHRSLRPGFVRALRPAVAPPDSAADAAARASLRRELDAAPEEILIGAIDGRGAPGGPASLLLAACPALARDVHGARFAITALGRARAALQRRIESLGLTGRVAFVPPGADPAGTMPALDLFVHPGRDGAAELLAAMAAGLPVIASRCDEAPDIVEEGESGLLVPPGEQAPLASACLALLKDGTLRARMGRRGRERAAAVFGPERAARDVASLYREILDRAIGGTPAAARPAAEAA